mmetsp:Transcript_28059/g.47191  ORF Transcript_28059/g.47191 Transcript_28059/m.47191 type:complete len:189 (+) Transcript_28059:272-838(+)|eukprot:CAMPEP_0174976328 /NCGR_PEP_ID=MMETSP0004_2-20121128/12964_1 /TAXON_ID=420556 /ORGANISM="Ochromonas sp., Strain CCMP1393" /LENGTH=188 /DNA_ID=CAMNT_0016227331 /DNA_START=255 /DNA_END=821 /DNA_ORIENTATION=-
MISISRLRPAIGHLMRPQRVSMLSIVVTPADVDNANEKGVGVWMIKDSGEKGWGIFAQSKIAKSQMVFKATCLSKGPERDSHSVQLDWDTHVQMDLPARFINHSCDANVGVKDNAEGAFDFFALRDIEEGAELTWDYGAAEFHSISISKCLCGSPMCRGENISFEMAHKNIRSQYGDYYANYLHNWQP